jgi:FkbH-like protein
VRAVTGASERSTADSLRLSSFAVVADAGDNFVLANVAEPFRIVVERSLGEVVARCAAGPMTCEQFVRAGDQRGVAERLLPILRKHRILISDPEEDEAQRRALARLVPDSPETAEELARRALEYRTPSLVREVDLPEAGALADATVLMLGGCVLAFAQEALFRAGMAEGLNFTFVNEWPRVGSDLAEQVSDAPADMAVLQLSIQPLLAPLWDDFSIMPPEQRRRRLTSLRRLVVRMAGTFAAALDGRLGLIHNFAPPSVSPFGRMDFRQAVNVRDVISELNAAIDEVARSYSHLMVVDEERLTARHGAGHLFDDQVFPFSHHGGAVDTEDPTPHQTEALGEALANEYLALYRIHHGLARIRCVVVDLDGTLWPGIGADDGLEWLAEDTTTRWMHVGLHHALKIVKHRGILLATASKGSAGVTLPWWEGIDSPELLMPADFVDHKISWRNKSEAIAELSDQLGMPRTDILLLDDSPVERAEVLAKLPGIQAYDSPVSRFRSLLLGDHRLEVREVTAEADRRTESTRGLLARERSGGDQSHEEFLVSLGIEVGVRTAGTSDSARVAELFERTTQFSTTDFSPSPAEVERLLPRPDCHVLLSSVKDRFADYGVCSALVIDQGRIVGFVLSCRVIGLEPELAILRAALEIGGALRPGTQAEFAETERNRPAADVFERAGFEAMEDGMFELTDPGAVTARCEAPHLRVSWIEPALEDVGA